MKKYLLLFLCLTSASYAQDTIYLQEIYKEADSRKDAAYFKIIQQDNDNSGLVTEKTYYLDNKIKLIEIFRDYYSEDRIRTEYTEYYRNGQPRMQGNYQKGRLDTYLTTYWENGQVKRKDVYKKGKLESGTCWDQNGKQVEYYDFEIKPRFLGGPQIFQLYLKNKLREVHVPANLKRSKVLVRFTIDETGKVTNVLIKKSLSSNIEKEIKKVFEEMPRWSAAKQDGEPVAVSRLINIVL